MDAASRCCWVNVMVPIRSPQAIAGLADSGGPAYMPSTCNSAGPNRLSRSAWWSPTRPQDVAGPFGYFGRASLADFPYEPDQQRGRARRTPQDHLAHRQRPPRQRRWLGLQDLRARDALLPLHLREPHRVPQRAGARGRDTPTSTTPAQPTRTPSSAATRRSRRRASTSSRSELFANVRKRARQRREPQRDAGAGSSPTSRGPAVGAESARTTSRACSTTSTSTAPSSARPSRSATRSS